MDDPQATHDGLDPSLAVTQNPDLVSELSFPSEDAPVLFSSVTELGFIVSACFVVSI